MLLLTFYVMAMCMAADEGIEVGQGWIFIILVLLLGVNDPLYPVRVFLLGSEALETVATVIQILFSATLFLFWLIMADGMQRAGAKTFCTFYCLKACIVGLYTASACALFGMYGRIPDRLEVTTLTAVDTTTTALVATLIISLAIICIWLSILVVRLTHHLGWKKVEYIYTDREKSFVGMTLVFMLLWVCGLVYRALHGQRGSWLMLQLPFLALCNSYLVLLAHAFWPGTSRGGRRAAAEAMMPHLPAHSPGEQGRSPPSRQPWPRPRWPRTRTRVSTRPWTRSTGRACSAGVTTISTLKPRPGHDDGHATIGRHWRPPGGGASLERFLEPISMLLLTAVTV